MKDTGLDRLISDMQRARQMDRRADHRLRQVVQRLRLIEARVCDTDPCTARELRDIIEGMRG